MTYFKRTRFSGIAPAVSPKLLGDQFGTAAYNLDFERGNLKPLKAEQVNPDGTRGVYRIQGLEQPRSIYYYETPLPQEYWLSWDSDYVKAVPGPIPGDTQYRLYWTGDGPPRYSTFDKITAGSGPYPNSSWALGIPDPNVAPSVVIEGPIDEEIDPVEEYAWVYTYVSIYGEEGPPSPASALYEFTPTTQTARVTCTAYSGQDVPPNSLVFGESKIRLYRSNTGSDATFFQFVDEKVVTASTVVFEDDFLDVELGEVLPSGTWIGPPDGGQLYPDGSLQGLISVANGVMAGHVGKRLCMSEPYLPHAWPVANRITLERDIVAIGTTANGIVALTDGKPYFVTGVEPSAMTAITIDLAQACNNKFSVVDMGDYLLYCGPDGLCAVSGGEGKVVTKGLIDVDTWRNEYKPDEVKAFFWEGRYLAFFPKGGNAWIYDPRASEAALSWVNETVGASDDIYGGYTVLKDGTCYFIDQRDIVPFATGDEPRQARWRSKTFVAESPCSMAWLSIDSQDFTADMSSIPSASVRIYIDNLFVCQCSFFCKYEDDQRYFRITMKLNDKHPEFVDKFPNGSGSYTEIARTPYPIVRLPPIIGYEFSFEVQSNIQIDTVTLASTVEELRAV